MLTDLEGKLLLKHNFNFKWLKDVNECKVSEYTISFIYV